MQTVAQEDAMVIGVTAIAITRNVQHQDYLIKTTIIIIVKLQMLKINAQDPINQK